jgi:hypothetical protein
MTTITPSSRLKELAAKCEQAAADEQADLLREAFILVHGPKPERLLGGSPELATYLDHLNPFVRLINNGGFLDAAMTLMPEGWVWVVDAVGRASCFKPDSAKPWPRAGGVTNTPALALCAAALRAHAKLKGEGNE